MAQKGKLIVYCFIGESYIPVNRATVSVRPSSSSGEKWDIVMHTNDLGKTMNLELDAPKIEYSQNPSRNQPYSTYDIKIEKEGF